MDIGEMKKKIVYGLNELCYARYRSASRIQFPKAGIELRDRHDFLQVLNVVDMSAGGIRPECILPQPYQVGSRISVAFSQPDLLQETKVGAIIKNVTPVSYQTYHLGCEFIFPDDQVRSRLAEWSAKALASRLSHRGRKSGWEFHPVKSSDERQRAFHLVYREYVKRGYIDQNPSQV